MEGVRFLYEALNEYRTKSNPVVLEQMRRGFDVGTDFVNSRAVKDAAWEYGIIAKLLDDPETKRVLFDSRQAALFDDLGPVDEAMQGHLHLPFNQFYIEFTEPITLNNSEPGWTDVSCALIVSDPKLDYSFGASKGKLIQVTLLLTGYREGDHRGPKTFVDRSWKIDLQRGTAITEIGALRRAAGGYIKDLPGEAEGVPNTAYWPIGMRTRKKREGATFVGWSERSDHPAGNPEDFEPYIADDADLTWYEVSLMNDTALLSWCVAYMMAKSIVFVDEWEPRGHRRRLLREGKVPQPWHVVRVDPKVILNRAPPGPEGQTHHSYRYDVMGHLRFGHHPRANGSFSDTIEWVNPHQRGLANAVYIPKTYFVDKGKPLHVDAAKGYFGRGP